MFTLHNKYYICIVYYHSKVPVIKKMEDLLECKIIFSEYGLPKKISDAGDKYTSDKFKRFFHSTNTEQAVSSLYHH